MKNGKMGKRVDQRCEYCEKLFKLKDMRYDHIEPVVKITGFEDWSTYISRMFDTIPHGIRHSCVPCHSAKTADERERRKAHKHGVKSAG